MLVYCELFDSRDTIMVVIFFFFLLFMNLMFEYRCTEQMHYHSLWFILTFCKSLNITTVHYYSKK